MENNRKNVDNFEPNFYGMRDEGRDENAYWEPNFDGMRSEADDGPMGFTGKPASLLNGIVCFVLAMASLAFVLFH